MKIMKFTESVSISKDDIESLVMDLIEDGFIDIRILYRFASSDLKHLDSIPSDENNIFVCVLLIGAKLLKKDSAIATNITKKLILNFYLDI